MTPILPITVYSFHLILLSCLNIALLSLNAFEFGMGLSIFGHGNKGTAHWEPDPTDRRGTWTILLTCIITLTLCVYTSLHLNVPSHKSSTGFAIGMKAKYVIFGLLAPELMVFNAWRQRTVASSIVATLRKDRGVTPRISWFRRLLQGLQTSTRKTYQSIKSIPKLFIGGLKKEKHERGLPSVADKDPWADVTLVHGFYMVMGGYAFDASRGPKPRIWPRKVDRLTPSPMAILGCLTSQDKSLREILPYLSEEEIWDKSKANGLAKAIVCIQAAWFCTQCIARLGQGIPISLLELNTFAHAICALLIYILWWSKPLDVHEPTVIDVGQSETARSICALAWSGPQAPVPHLRRVSPADNRLWKRFLNRFGHFIGTFSECYLGDGPLLSSPILSRSSTSNQQRSAQIADLERPLALTKRPTSFEGLDVEQLKSRVWVSTDPPAFVLKGGEAIPSTSLHVSTEWKTIDVDEVLLERLGVVEKLQNQANYAAYGKCFSRLLDTTDPDLCMLKPRELNFTDSLMRQNSNVSSVDGNLTGAAGIILSGVVYGGLHAIAWGSTAFSSPLEDLAWKISCFIVAGGGLFIFAGIYGLKMMTKRKPANGRIDATKVLVYGSAPIFIAFFLLYLVCRVYLVFEVFRNLAYLDPRVYKTPKWSAYFPHIS